MAYSVVRSGDAIVDDVVGYDAILDTLYLRGAHNNWDTSTSMNLVADNTWSAEIDHQGPLENGFKFDALGDWTLNWGLGDTANSTRQNGDNIPFPNGFGFYRIEFNDVTYAYSITAIDSLSEAPVENNNALIATGASAYSAQCALCPGAGGIAGSSQTPIDLSQSTAALASTIETTMPWNNASACDADCANAISVYLKSLNISAENHNDVN